MDICLQKQVVFFFVMLWYVILEHPCIGVFLVNFGCLLPCLRFWECLIFVLCSYSRYLKTIEYGDVQGLIIGIQYYEQNLLHSLLTFTCLFGYWNISVLYLSNVYLNDAAL